MSPPRPKKLPEPKEIPVNNLRYQLNCWGGMVEVNSFCKEIDLMLMFHDFDRQVSLIDIENVLYTLKVFNTRDEFVAYMTGLIEGARLQKQRK